MGANGTGSRFFRFWVEVVWNEVVAEPKIFSWIGDWRAEVSLHGRSPSHAVGEIYINDVGFPIGLGHLACAGVDWQTAPGTWMEITCLLDFRVNGASKVLPEGYCHFEAGDRRSVVILKRKREVLSLVQSYLQGRRVSGESERCQ